MKHQHAWVKIGPTKESCGLCDQVRKIAKTT